MSIQGTCFPGHGYILSFQLSFLRIYWKDGNTLGTHVLKWIIDLARRGRTPMSDNEGGIWIVYNGFDEVVSVTEINFEV